MILLTVAVMLAYSFISVGIREVDEMIYMVIAACVLLAGSILSHIYEKVFNHDIFIFKMTQMISGLGAVAAYAYGYMEAYCHSFLIAMVGFLMTYILTRFSNLYKLRICGFGCMVGMPLLLLLTRILGNQINGAYLSIFENQSLLTSACLMLMAPVAMAYALSTKIENFHNRKENVISGSQCMLFANILLCIIIAGFINKDSVSVLLIGGTATFFFFLYGADLRTKVIIPGCCMMAAVIAAVFSVWQQDLSAANEEIVFVDTKMVSFIFTVLAVILVVVLVIRISDMYTEYRYDRYLISALSAILAILVIVSFAGNYGSFVIKNTVLWFSVQAKSVNAALFMLAGMVMAIQSRNLPYSCK